MAEPHQELTYDPGVFNVRTLQEAKNIVLTPEPNRTTNERWRVETPYLLDLIEINIPGLNSESVVLDYGCGAGRMSKALIERFGCWVIGVDISSSMRAHAADYVKSNRFMTCAPEGLLLVAQCDLAISIWVLQHCYKPEEDIARINKALKLTGNLFVVNDRKRYVPIKTGPTTFGWADDGRTMTELLHDRFGVGTLENLDPDIMGLCGKSSFCAVYSPQV